MKRSESSAERSTKTLPSGYQCEKPISGADGAFEECWYKGSEPAAIA